METTLFWVAWGLISFWALKTFYYSFSKDKLERLRKTALGINLAVFILAFLPWLPASSVGGLPSLGGTSGLKLALEGNIFSALFIILLVVSMALFLTKDTSRLKLASIATITNTILLFIIMYALRPETFTLTLFDIAPIIAVMFLLASDVVVLLLWQQLQLMDKKKNKK